MEIPKELANGTDPILSSKDLKVLMTKFNFFIFSMKIKQVDDENQCYTTGKVKIGNVQKFDFRDFEFMQVLVDPQTN